MKIFSNILSRLFPDRNKILTEASFEDYGFKSVGKTSNEKGISELSRDIQLKIAFQLWLKNGFAKRLVELPIEFIVGDSLFEPEFLSRNNKLSQEQLDECKKVIKDFVTLNKLNRRFEKFLTDLSINGMLILPVDKNTNGDIGLGFIDPSKIRKVRTNPYDVLDIIALKMKSNWTEKGSEELIVINESSSPHFSREEHAEGDVFYYSINNVSNQPEGVSDLLADSDLIENLYKLLIGIIEGSNLANMFVLDVEIEGASPEQITQWKKENPLPTRPSRFVHNSKIKQQIINSGVQAFDNPEVIRVIKNFILGNRSYPPMWFADGQDANRAIALEQGTPVYKKLIKRQELAITILKDLYTYALYTASKGKEGFNIKPDALLDLDIQIKAPEIQVKNLGMLTNSLIKLTDSIDKAESKKWISGKTVQKVFISFLNMLGMDIDTQSEITELENESKEPAPVLQYQDNKKTIDEKIEV